MEQYCTAEPTSFTINLSGRPTKVSKPILSADQNAAFRCIEFQITQAAGIKASEYHLNERAISAGQVPFSSK
jgi:hypothetical protein